MNSPTDKPGTTGQYKTSDLYYAAYLKVAGVEHVDTTNDGPRTYFVFKTPEGGIRDLKNGYFNRQAKVAALTYADEVRSLKALMHMGADGE